MRLCSTIIICIFISFHQITYKLGSFTDFKAFFLAVLINWSQSKVEKKNMEVIKGLSFREKRFYVLNNKEVQLIRVQMIAEV